MDSFGGRSGTTMARFWKEPYTLERALAAGIRDFENAPVVGLPNTLWIGRPEFRDWPEWIYYVEVCKFTFVFFSLAMIRQYLEFYSQKVLPSSRMSGSLWYPNGDNQRWFERLPLRLRKEPKRQR